MSYSAGASPSYRISSIRTSEDIRPFFEPIRKDATERPELDTSASIRKTYPYSQGTFLGDKEAGIDYTSLVVPFNGTCWLPCLKEAMETAMQNATRMRQIRLNMQKYASLFTYRLDESSDFAVDAFMATVVSIRHYLSKLEKREKRNRG